MKPPIHKKNCDPCKLCGCTTRFRRSDQCAGCVLLNSYINGSRPDKDGKEPDEIDLLMRHFNGERVNYGGCA